ncbi:MULTISPECIES: hypothetical protein [unclassified Kitasatospora]|uniref:hypothetical protein n=1 Tax=Kitasatospora sp. NPDC057512 TaxID=3346154 RepID=UPI003694B96F
MRYLRLVLNGIRALGLTRAGQVLEGLPADFMLGPHDVRDLAAAQIKRQRRSLARQDALQQRAYARLVTELAGPERGGKTRAGKALGVTDVQIGRIIREDQERRALLASKVSNARDDYDL